jgi:hypothetical protein
MRFKYLDGYYILVCTRCDIIQSSPGLPGGHFFGADALIINWRAHADRSRPFSAAAFWKRSRSSAVTRTRTSKLRLSPSSLFGRPAICKRLYPQNSSRQGLTRRLFVDTIFSVERKDIKMIDPKEITDGITTGVEVRKQRGLEIAAIIWMGRERR